MNLRHRNLALGPSRPCHLSSPHRHARPATHPATPRERGTAATAEATSPPAGPDLDPPLISLRLPRAGVPFVRVLGVVSVENVDPGHRRQETFTALTTFLAFHPGARRQDIADQMLQQATPKSTLAPRMSEMRHWLGRHPVTGESLLPLGHDGYRLHSSITTDLHLLRQLRVSPLEEDLELALDLATGVPFSGVRPNWYQWASDLYREAQTSLTASALHLTRARLRRGALSEAVDAATRGLALDPSHEPLRRAQLRALHKLGDTTGLRRSLQELRSANESLAAEAEPATRQLICALRETIRNP